MAERGGRAKDEKARHWGDVMGAWEASGLTQAAFCRQEGIALSTFQYWRRRLVAGRGQRKEQGDGRVNDVPRQKLDVPVREPDAALAVSGSSLQESHVLPQETGRLRHELGEPRPVPVNDNTPPFVPVTVRSPGSVGSSTAPELLSCVTVVLTNGRRLEVPSGVDVDWLARVAAALEAPPC